jgi:hypothetical protein
MVPVPTVAVVNEAGEQTPLLHPPNGEANTKADFKKPSDLKAATQYLLCLAFVVAAGITAWSISRHYSVGEDPDAPAKKPKVVLEWKSQVIGWMSAVLYCESPILILLRQTLMSPRAYSGIPHPPNWYVLLCFAKCHFQ